jgi:hypothetical protein
VGTLFSSTRNFYVLPSKQETLQHWKNKFLFCILQSSSFRKANGMMTVFELNDDDDDDNK